MSLPLGEEPLAALALLPHTTASDVKKLGWRGLMKTIRSKGKMVVTNHNEPEAVILSVEEYAELIQLVRTSQMNTASTLDTLRQQFDQRLSTLQAADAGDRLRAIMKGPAKLEGKVKAGTRY